MSSTLPVANIICPDCHAENQSPATACWLCHRNFAAGPEIITAELVSERPASAPSEILFGTLTACVAIVVVLIGIGIGSDEAYLLIPYTLVVGLGLAITLLREVRIRVGGGKVGWGERLLTFIISVHAIGAVLGVLFVAAAIAFVVFLILVCTGGIGHS